MLSKTLHALKGCSLTFTNSHPFTYQFTNPLSIHPSIHSSFIHSPINSLILYPFTHQFTHPLSNPSFNIPHIEFILPTCRRVPPLSYWPCSFRNECPSSRLSDPACACCQRVVRLYLFIYLIKVRCITKMIRRHDEQDMRKR